MLLPPHEGGGEGSAVYRRALCHLQRVNISIG